MTIGSDRDLLAGLKAVGGEKVTRLNSSGTAFLVYAVFDMAHELGNIGDEGLSIIGTGPVLTCRASDVAGLSQSDSFIVRGVTYSVAQAEPDGTGGMVIQLTEAS